MSSVRNRRSVVKRVRLGLEVLEERAVPASVLFSGGNLTISNLLNVGGVTNLQVTEPSSGLFLVTDSGHVSGSYRVTGDIKIIGSNLPNTIGVTLNTGDLPGSLTICGGNNADNITVDGTTGTESIRGNLYIDGGYGNDMINVGTTNGLTIRGSATIIGNLGTNTVNLGNVANPSVTIRSGLALYSSQNVTLTKTTVLGASQDTLQTSPTNTAKVFTPLSLTVQNSSALNGQLSVTAGSLTNGFTFDGTSTLSRTIINAPGTNTLDLASVVNGNFTFTSGNANNSITVEATAWIHPFGTTDAGNLTFNLGNGTNTYNLGAAFHVDGGMTMTAGSGDQNVATFGGTVSGLLSIAWGTGANVFTLDNGSASAINYTLASGAVSNTLNIFNDGVSSNNITITVPATVGGSYSLILNFGGGSALAQAVTLNGGTASMSGPSSGNITINKNGDTNVNVTNNLLGDIIVTQNA